MVLDTKGKLAGFLDVGLLSYTEDPDISSFADIDDEDLKDLPKDLQP